MAFPFAQAPTVAQFVEFARKHGCELRELPQPAIGPRGPTTIQYLSRQDNGALRLSEPLPEDHADRLSPDTIRRLVGQLSIPNDLWPWDGGTNDLET